MVPGVPSVSVVSNLNYSYISKSVFKRPFGFVSYALSSNVGRFVWDYDFYAWILGS